MKDFREWCIDNNLIHEDGTVVRKKKEQEPVKGKLIGYTDKKSKDVRDMRQDLSKDYKNYARSFGTVWPHKVLTK